MKREVAITFWLDGFWVLWEALSGVSFFGWVLIAYMILILLATEKRSRQQLEWNKATAEQYRAMAVACGIRNQAVKP